MRLASYLKKFAIIVLVLVGLSVVQTVYYYPRLPDTVASHFDLWGNADGWMGKRTFCVLGPIMLLIVTFPIGLIGLVMHAVSAPAAAPPTEAMNDEQQTEVERNRKGQEMLADAVGSFGLWFGLLTGLLLLFVMQLAFQANLCTPPKLDHALPALIAYLAAIGVLGVWKGRQAILAQRLLPPREIPAGVWFPAKRFGWGWGPPVCWQGWTVMIAWCAIFLVGLRSTLIHPKPGSPFPGTFILFTVVMIAALLAIVWWKGERPRWRWGE